MPIPWPSERISRAGLVEFLIAVAGLVFGVVTLRQAGLTYITSTNSKWLLPTGLAALAVCGFALFRIVKRREYPWIVAFAAVALPLYEPSQAPYGLADRVVFAIRDLALLAAAVFFLARALRATDELEHRIQLEGLAWSYSVVLVALIAYALAEDILPPLRGVWVASLMLASWALAWAYTSFRYQR